MSIKSFPDYKRLLQEKYVEYKHIFLSFLKLVSKKKNFLSYILKKKYVYIPRIFLVISVCNQGKILCSPCILFFLVRLSMEGGKQNPLFHVSIVTNHQLFRELNISSECTGALFFLTTVVSRFA